ncbi:CAAX prenyl protease 2-like isoform X2 [Xenia sp. Carnegie-2017]|uniref:CAAX prenyl protease 2-like isoform X2 n=1 Tax=Xenia sp. Carnegie-2017 TaxID=2897299 RepID=UPI001F043848|nr:CAAX prenyl protease 2-like isoform X2 [Xenia sp. Carnegie-2017]
MECAISSGVPVQRWLGIHGENLNKAAVFPSLLIMILFAGPLTMMCLAEELPLMKKFSPSFDLINIRNLIIAPITEEFIYRACMIPLLVPSFGLMGAIFICPLLFGVAHFHHAIERLQGSKSNVLIVTFFQFSYTTLFGVYSAFIFVRTGHLIGSFISHSFCNYMGVPEFEQINNTKFPKVVAGMFVIGLVLFLCFLFPLTEPNMYNSIYFK